ncbi:hypothetical protein N9W89_06470, partial [Hellea sp.]|nr:hypothetical protein [Hellea sp.]
PHITPPSSQVGDVSGSMSDFWRGIFLTSVWMWTELFCKSALAQKTGELSPEPLTMAERFARLGFQDVSAMPYLRLYKTSVPPNRHRRRMIARRKRGIAPPSRYAYYGQGGPLRARLSRAELRHWAKHRFADGRFQWFNYKFYLEAVFRRTAFWLSRKCGLDSLMDTIYPAPLMPD